MLTPEIKTNLILKEIGIQRYSLRSKGKIISQKTYHYFLKGKILAIFDPIIFPKVSSVAPLITASIDTNNSQSEVPNPITIIPIKISERLNFLPIDIAELISKSAPHNTRTKPKKSSRKNINILNYFYASFQTSKQNVLIKILN